jgi:hypothetical protein
MRHRDFRYQVAEKQAQVQGLTLSPLHPLVAPTAAWSQLVA